MNTKKVIQRNLSLDQKYILLHTNYISLVDGYGCACDNCGKLIANIATVMAEKTGNVHSVGFDCLETFLINNNLLDGKGVDHYTNVVKKCVPKIKREREYMKEFLKKNEFIKSVTIEYEYNWITYNFFNAVGKQVWNDGSKAKILDVEMLLASLQTINKDIKFTIKN